MVDAIAGWLGLAAACEDRPDEEARVRRAVMTRIADVKAERVTWLWRGRIPRGCVTEILGDADTGKSTSALDLPARVTKGATDAPCRPCPTTSICWKR